MKSVSAHTLAAVLLGLALSVLGGDTSQERPQISSGAVAEPPPSSPDTAESSAVAAQPTSSSTSSADRSGHPGQATEEKTPAVSDPAFDSTQAWAAGRYERAGLTMPDALIHVHDDRTPCEGHVAIFVGTEPTPEIHLCFRR